MKPVLRISIVAFWLIFALAPGFSNPQMASASQTPHTTALTLNVVNQNGPTTAIAITVDSPQHVYLPFVAKPAECSTIPTLLSPANGSNLNTIIPLFMWDNGNNPKATTLRLQVARDSGFTQSYQSLRSSGSPGADNFRFPPNFDAATTFYWRAWLMCGNTQGPYSEVWSFTTGSGGTILPAPILTAPANGSTTPVTPVNLQWAAVPGTVEYLVSWRKPGEGGFSYMWVNNTQATITWLSANTTYEWWVSARNDYATGASSGIWQFTTQAATLSLPPEDLNQTIIVVEEDGLNNVLSR